MSRPYLDKLFPENRWAPKTGDMQEFSEILKQLVRLYIFDKIEIQKEIELPARN